MAAVLACGPGAALSHRSAAACWELLPSAASLIDVTAALTRAGAPGIRLHRSRSLDARDTTTQRGIPITTIPRTLLDLAATVHASTLERALAQAQRAHLYDHRAITDLIARSNGHRGTGALARAIAHEEPKWTRSEYEAWFLALVRDAGLPEPLVNLTLVAPDHPRLEVDPAGRRTASSLRRTAGRTTGPGPPSSRIDGAMRRCKRTAGACCASRGMNQRKPSNAASKPCCIIDPCASPSQPTNESGSRMPWWTSCESAAMTS
jgi:hypothetical protein